EGKGSGECREIPKYLTSKAPYKCCCQPAVRMMPTMVAPLGRLSRARTRACLEPARPLDRVALPPVVTFRGNSSAANGGFTNTDRNSIELIENSKGGSADFVNDFSASLAFRQNSKVTARSVENSGVLFVFSTAGIP